MSSSNIIPTKWIKFGEVYFNELDQPVFICLVCLEKADSITNAFNTSNGSELLGHIQEQHSHKECETKNNISVEIDKFETNINDVENNSRSAEPSKLVEQQLKTLEIFHDNLIKENGIFNDIKFKDESNPDQLNQILTPNQFAEEFIKIEVKDKQFKNSFPICNYYNNETYTISDDDDEDSNDEDCDKDFVHAKIVSKQETTNYLLNKVSIEISDDENDIYKQDDVNTRPTTPRFINSECNKVDDTTNLNPFNMFHWLKPYNYEDNVQFPQPNSSIPTSKTSPCETKTNGKMNTNFETSDYNTDCGYVCTQSIIPPPKKRPTAFRPYQCKICGSRTINEKNMLIHQQRLHNIASSLEAQKHYHQIDEPYVDKPVILFENENNISPCRKPFRCKTCKRRTKTKKSMERHQQLYHSPNTNLSVKLCGICHKRVFSDKLQQHMLLHTLKGFKCNYCGVVYKQKSYLNLHVSKYHSG